MSRKQGGRGLASIEDNVNASIQRLEEKCGRRLITASRNNTGNTMTNTTEKTENKNGKKNNSMDVLSN